MQNKTILITGATDCIGLVKGRLLNSMGHTLLLHGRNSAKLEKVQDELMVQSGKSNVAVFPESEFVQSVSSR